MNQHTREDIDRRDRAILKRSITPEVLEVLERRYGFQNPLYPAEMLMSTIGNDVFLRQALIKDGQRQVISYIRSCITNDHD